MRLTLVAALAIVSIYVFALAQPQKNQDSKSKKKQPEHTDHKHEETDEKEEGHQHSEDESAAQNDHEGEEHAHAEGEKDEHGHGGHDEHEENPQVGPNKGILEASESDGIKLSPEAEKNFEIARLKIPEHGPIEIPRKSVVTAISEVNVFRYRNGFYKRIDFETLNRREGVVTIKSKDLKFGDEIVVGGLGFLRTAEIAAFGGAPEGHSH